MIELKVLRLAHAEGLEIPSYQSAGAAGADVCAAVEGNLAIFILVHVQKFQGRAVQIVVQPCTNNRTIALVHGPLG